MAVGGWPESMLSAITSADDARAWVAALPDVSRGTLEQLDHFIALLRAENTRQNLIAASTSDGDTLWCRHILDSAQLLPLATAGGRSKRGQWVDLGSGPGLPGMVIAILGGGWTVTLVESRRIRSDFLHRAVAELGLGARVSVRHDRVETMPAHAYDIISARAFAPLPRLLPMARHLAGKTTTWLLPKGKKAKEELAVLPCAWQTAFKVHTSMTSADSHILVGHGAMDGAKPPSGKH